MKPPAKNACNQFYKLMCEDLEQKLNSPQCRALRRHLQECSRCSSCLEEVRETIELFRRYKEPPLPRGARRKLFEALKLG